MNKGKPAGEQPVADPGRRRFLVGTAAAATALAVGCSSDDGGSSVDQGTTAPPTTAVVVPDSVPLDGVESDPFSLGVASGDPLVDAVVIWTRLAPDPLADDGGGGMSADAAEVVWEVALDPDFASLVAAGSFTTTAEHAHAVHVDVTGLAAGTDHHYRFTAGEWVSPVGRTRTLPDGSPDRFALAVANCQMLESGEWGAYRHMVDEDLDLVLHLGDYIYEYVQLGGGRAPSPNGHVVSLEDYRLRYASYKVQPELREAHARFPFVLTWDDHEVANNYAGTVLPGDHTTADGVARRTAAYQAWWEHLPVRLDPPVAGELEIHRAFQIGDLARLHVLDERQHSDPVPCRPEPEPGDPGLFVGDHGDCEERLGEDRTYLGAEQERWIGESLAEGGVTWNLLGNPVVLAGIDTGTDPASDEGSYYLETWDGFPRARLRLIEQLAASSNPVVLTGDYHAGMALDVHADPFDPASAVVAPEMMAPAISSHLFADDVSARTPHLRQQINAHGYLTVEVTPERVTAAFRTVADVQDPATAIETAATWVIDDGDPVARPA